MSLPSSMADFVPRDRQLQKAYYRKSRRLETYSAFNTNEIKYKNAEIKGNQYALLRISSLLAKSCTPRRDDEQKLS